MQTHLQRVLSLPHPVPHPNAAQRQHSLPVHPAPAPVWSNGCLRWLGVVARPEPQG